MGKITGVWLIKYRTEDRGDKPPPRSLPTLLAVLVDDTGGGGSVWSGGWLMVRGPVNGSVVSAPHPGFFFFFEAHWKQSHLQAYQTEAWHLFHIQQVLPAIQNVQNVK